MTLTLKLRLSDDNRPGYQPRGCPRLPRDLSVPGGAVTERRAEARVPSWTWERWAPPQRFSISRASTSPFVMGGGRRDFPGCCKLGSEFDLGAQFSANRKLK